MGWAGCVSSPSLSDTAHKTRLLEAAQHFMQCLAGALLVSMSLTAGLGVAGQETSQTHLDRLSDQRLGAGSAARDGC